VSKTVGGSHTVQFGTATIPFELLLSDRKTLAVHVYPDGSVVVDAPHDTDLDRIRETVYKRGAWILRQQRELATYPQGNPHPRQYVSGESYRYLGRQYKLKVQQDTVERVVLTRGALTVGVHNPADTARIRDMLRHWYTAQARRVFSERLEACYPRVEYLGIPHPQLAIREMKARWGSCSPSGRITLNAVLIQAPKSLIDYVILHELCHMKEMNHSPAFFSLLTRTLPNWKRLQAQLNQYEFFAFI
jgi:predicted metal-dependent hydrolase